MSNSTHPFFITTAIPYVNARIHIGNALEYVLADSIARSARLLGQEVKFLVGTDEHGQKIAEAAAKEGVSPQEFADKNADYFLETIKALEISNDDYIRTSDQKRHWPVVQALWRKLVAAGDIYKKEYEGLYCVGCESFKTSSELNEAGECSIHLTKPEVVLEENYFFALSKYSEQVKSFIKDAVRPTWRQQELLNFVDQGLTDISFSRPAQKLSWGIPVPDDDSQVIYVWCDALTNYLSAASEVVDDEIVLKGWPADVHVIGKDIAKFHAIYWPAMLLSAGIPLPKTILVHGFISIDHQKISKSLGNVILPHDLIATYGTDALRYYYLKEIPTTDDGDFSYAQFEGLVDADLANTIGNLFQRVLVMAAKFDVTWTLGEAKADEAVLKQILDFEGQAAITALVERAAGLNRAIAETKPWELAKTDLPAAQEFLKGQLEELAVIAATLAPIIPASSKEMLAQLKSRAPKPLFEHVSGRHTGND